MSNLDRDAIGGASGKRARTEREKKLSIERRYERKVRNSRLALVAERAWPRVWLPLAVIGIFVLVSLSGLWPFVPAWAHKGLLALFALVLLASLFPIFFQRWPSRDEALRRIEQKSGLRHRPLSAYEDQLTGFTPSANTRRLWRAHRARAAALFKRLRSGWPHPRVDRSDPFALRALLVLLLLVGGIASGTQSLDRLRAAFQLGANKIPDTLRLDAWVTPPHYTRKPPLLLADGARPLPAGDSEARVVEIPQNSILIVRVNGAQDARLNIGIKEATGAGRREIPQSDPGATAGVFEYKFTLKETGTVDVTDGTALLYGWHFNVIPDLPPKIGLIKPPETTPRGAIKFSYKVEDDYGVIGAKSTFVGVDEQQKKEKPEKPEKADPKTAGEKPLGEAPVIPLTLPRTNPKSAESKVYKDLMSHPWAGLTVDLILEATDQAGQTGQSKPFRMVLPARKFTKPLARAIVEQRRKLVLKPRSNREKVAMAIDALTIAPEKFIEDRTVYLGLRTVYWGLKHHDSRKKAQESVDRLWDIALRIEDGDLSDAERALRDAQDRLSKALQENAPESEIKKLIDELRTALNRFLQALAKKNGDQNLVTLPENFNLNRMLSPKDLEQLLKNIENLAKTGSRNAAQQLLSELRDLLEGLQRGRSQGSAQAQRMMKMMEELGELINRQQRLLDDTFATGRQNRQQGERPGRGGARKGDQAGRSPGDGDDRGEGSGKSGKGGKGKYGTLAARQKALREMLEQMLEDMRALGANPPDQLKGAGRAMGDAGKALDDKDTDRATQQQTLALDRLRQGAQSMAQSLLRGLVSRFGRTPRDPLGRPQRTQGPDLGTSVKVPDEIDVQRAREILEELRRRLSEPARPALELDYIERLLRRF